jgi:hypothetical protein
MRLVVLISDAQLDEGDAVVDSDLNRRSLLWGGGAAVAAAAAAVGTSVITAGPAAADPIVPLYIPVDPERLYDSREVGGPILSGQTRTLFAGGPPDPLFAACFNVTVVSTTGSSGFLSLFPGDIAWPGTSSINWFGPGQVLANNALTTLSTADGSIKVRCGATGGGGTHFILDLMALAVIADLAITATAIATTTQAAKEFAVRGSSGG